MRFIKPLSDRRYHRNRNPPSNNDDPDNRNADRICHRPQDDHTAYTTNGDQDRQGSRNDNSDFDSAGLQHSDDNHNEHVADHNDKLDLCSRLFVFGMWWLQLYRHDHQGH
ncbi:hypothetical protein KCU98_g2398, partial [Aureobasidium melanogenum]